MSSISHWLIGQVFLLSSGTTEHRDDGNDWPKIAYGIAKAHVASKLVESRAHLKRTNSVTHTPTNTEKNSFVRFQDFKAHLFQVTCFWQVLHKYQRNSAKSKEIFYFHSQKTHRQYYVLQWMSTAGILFILKSTQQTKVLRNHSQRMTESCFVPQFCYTDFQSNT